MVVAVMAAFLAIATFLANETVKEVITGETHRADSSAQLESNRLKIEINKGNSTLLEVLGKGTPEEEQAARETQAHETRIVHELEPADARLNDEIDHDEDEIEDANTSHVDFELAEWGSRSASSSPRSRSLPTGVGCLAWAAWPRAQVLS